MQIIPACYPFLVRAYEADASNRLKISSVFNFMQVAAGLNANDLGFGYSQLTPKGYFWVLSRVILEWSGEVRFDEEIVVETWPKGIDKLFALRDFRIYSNDGACIGKATSAWLMIDSQTGRPLILNSSMFNLPDTKVSPAINQTPGKLIVPHQLMQLGSRTAMYSDIDVNQHVNNAKYIEYIWDSLPDGYSSFPRCRMQINFLKEIRQGEKIALRMAVQENNDNLVYIEAMKSPDIKIFQAEILFIA